MRRHHRRSTERLDRLRPLKNPRGQVLIETLLTAMLLAGLFSLLLAFTEKTHRRASAVQWSQRNSR